MKNRLKYLAKRALLLLIVFGTGHASAVAQDKRPNFVFYILDDVGWDDFACYGNPVVKTPNFDALAANGLKFDNAYLTTSSCSPSRISILTGRYPHNTGAAELHMPIPAEQVMFTQLLKESGYYTALSGKNHIGSAEQLKVAFDLISSGKGPGGQVDWTSIIRGRPQERPFFFWFAAHDAHRDWQINDKGVIYNPEDIQVPPFLFDGPETRKDLVSYYHEISRADFYMGELIKELARAGILHNTYIILISDNGSPFPRSKSRLYDSGIKTPLIISGPDVKKGVNNRLMSAVDIAPTIMELAGLGQHKRMQGKSFLPVLKGKKGYRDFVFAEHNWHVFQAHERMVRYGDWLYIRNAYPGRRVLAAESTRHFPAGEELWNAYDKGLTNKNQEDVFMAPRPAEELYNVKDDPYQFNNLIDKGGNAKTLAILRNAMDTWIEETGDSVPKNPTPDRDDVYGKRLPGEWQRGEQPGSINKADTVNASGPIVLKDIKRR